MHPYPLALTFGVLALASCGSGTHPPVAAANAATSAAAAPDLATLDPALPGLVDRATAIVEGSVIITATRDGHVGTLQVRTILAGAVPNAVRFISAPFTLPADGIYFLAPEPGTPDTYRLLDDGVRAGFPAAWASAVGQAAPAPDPASAAAIAVQLASELATFRAARGQPWSPAQEPAVTAAGQIFARLPIAGRTVPDVVAILGEPDTSHAGGTIEYVRHMGEAGVIRRLRVHAGKVVGVEVILTQ